MFGIGNGINALLQHPSQAARLRCEPKVVDNAIEEFLRDDPPVEMATTGYAAEDVTIGNTHIPRGTPVIVILAAANREPAAYPTAHSLDITRSANKHLAFGVGIHYCVGAPLACLSRLPCRTKMWHCTYVGSPLTSGHN